MLESHVIPLFINDYDESASFHCEGSSRKSYLKLKTESTGQGIFLKANFSFSKRGECSLKCSYWSIERTEES